MICSESLPQQSLATGGQQPTVVTGWDVEQTGAQAARLPNRPQRPRPAQTGLKVIRVTSVPTVIQRNQYRKTLVMSPIPVFSGPKLL